MTNYVASSKFGGYGVLSTPENAALAPKFVGYGVLSTPENAVLSPKFVGYAVLTSVVVPAFTTTIVSIMSG